MAFSKSWSRDCCSSQAYKVNEIEMSSDFKVSKIDIFVGQRLVAMSSS